MPCHLRIHFVGPVYLFVPHVHDCDLLGIKLQVPYMIISKELEQVLFFKVLLFTYLRR